MSTQTNPLGGRFMPPPPPPEAVTQATPPADPAITGIAAFGTQIQVWTGSDFVSITGVGDITGFNKAVAEIETTSHSTGNPHRTRIPSLIDDGQLSFPCYWNPADPTHSASSVYGLEYLFENRIVQRFRMINTDQGHRAREFSGYVLSLGETYPLAGVCTWAAVIRSTSTPVEVASPIGLTPDTATATALGGPGTCEVATGGINVTWTAASDSSWLHVDDPTPQTGGGDADYTVDPQAAAAPARVGHIHVAALNLTLTVSQAAGT
jgi:hypothetical protein